MAHEREPAAGHPASLYDWWLRLLPAAAGAAGGAAEAGGGGAQPPFPVDRIAAGLEQTRALLDAWYGGALRALAAAPGADPLRAFEALVHERAAGLAGQLAAAGAASTAGDAAVPEASLAALSEALRPLSLGAERAFGGLADALGLAPLRTLDEAVRGLATAALDQRRAQAEVLGIAAGALGQGAEALGTRLAEMAARGESVGTLLELVRLWARTTDEAMHASMQSPRGIEASVALVRAVSRSREQRQRVVAIVSEALDVPTRAELDEAFREIQAIKRALRRARKGTGAADRTAASTSDVPSAAGVEQTRTRAPDAPGNSTPRTTPRAQLPSAPRAAQNAAGSPRGPRKASAP